MTTPRIMAISTRSARSLSKIDSEVNRA
jgi:hypothetical protein